jgi:adenosylhomocysteine nucleosidase
LIDFHRPRWIVSAGLAGALQPDLRRGNVIMPNEIVDQHGSLLSVGFSLPDGAVETTPGLKVGRLLTVDHLIRDPDEKRALGDEYQALACDMETMAVAQVCQERRIRFLAVRIISDTLDDRLPREIEQVLDQTTWAAKMGAATGALFRRPSSAKDLWKLREIALKASDKLARFLMGIVPQLAEHDAT